MATVSRSRAVSVCPNRTRLSVNDRHSRRFLLTPLEYTETGLLDTNLSFADQSFKVGQATDEKYQFKSYRATYRYRFFNGDHWQWHVGGTLKVRDAEIRLAQGDATAGNTDVGILPLLSLSVRIYQWPGYIISLVTFQNTEG